MAALDIVAGNVKQGAGADVLHGTAGATITAGQAICRDATTGKMVLSDADGTNIKRCDGIALNGAAADQPIAYQRAGDVTLGSVLTAGQAIYLAPTAGGIGPLADVAGGDDVVLIGIAKSASVLKIAIVNPGVTL
jgi:hypothetical protein